MDPKNRERKMKIILFVMLKYLETTKVVNISDYLFLPHYGPCAFYEKKTIQYERKMKVIFYDLFLLKIPPDGRNDFLLLVFLEFQEGYCHSE